MYQNSCISHFRIIVYFRTIILQVVMFFSQLIFSLLKIQLPFSEIHVRIHIRFYLSFVYIRVPHYLPIHINDDDASGNNKLTNIDSLRYRGICPRKNRILMRHTNRDITVNNIPRAIRSVLRHAREIIDGGRNKLEKTELKCAR